MPSAGSGFSLGQVKRSLTVELFRASGERVGHGGGGVAHDRVVLLPARVEQAALHRLRAARPLVARATQPQMMTSYIPREKEREKRETRVSNDRLHDF